MKATNVAGVFIRERIDRKGAVPALLLLHGAGADGEVWRPLLPLIEGVATRTIIPDLPGHGRSLPVLPYGIGNMAAQVSRLFDQNDRVCILGHSLGGAIGMALATNLYGITVDRVLAIDVKLDWAEMEVQKAREQAAKPSRTFDKQDAAVERYLKVSGLYGLIDSTSSIARSGVLADGDCFRLRADPRANMIAGTSIKPIISSMRSPLHLLTGTHNCMMSQDEMLALDPGGRVMDGCGHNIHMERPDLVAQWVAEHVGGTAGGAG